MKNFSGKGTITFDNGDVYEGAVRNIEPEPDGVGKMTYNDGRICEGIWKNGRIVYEGELDENGKPHGRGKWMYPDGTYDGGWKHGLAEGEGTLKWTDADGEQYEYKGGWKDDKYHGKGTYKWADGRSYEGHWKDDKKNGHGVMTYANQDVYDGEWRASEMHGSGVLKYANGDIYDGQWKNDHRDGQGTMKYHNGDVYEGEFSNDKLHGKGTYTYAEGVLSKSVGEWKEGKKCGMFDDFFRSHKQRYYDNDEVKANPKVKREDPCDEDTDNEDAPPSKRRNVCVSPPQV